MAVGEGKCTAFPCECCVASASVSAFVAVIVWKENCPCVNGLV